MPFDTTPITLPETPVIAPAREPDPVTEALNAARERLLTVGWTRGHMHDHAGYCALGAIYDSPLGDVVLWPRSEVQRLAVGRLRLAVGRRWITWWNDSGYRTKEDVIAGFDRAIDYRL